MYCTKCGHQNNDDTKFCMKCGQPMLASVPLTKHKTAISPKRKRGLSIIMLISALVLVVIIMVLLLTANPIAGRWYTQKGAELIMLKNGKGMTVTDDTGDADRVHFMYAIEYKEAGYIEGEIYEKESGISTWFYLYDGTLEMNGQYFYRQKPSVPTK